MTQNKDVVVSKEIHEYLDRIEGEVGRKIDEEQRRWYYLKQKILQDSMKQEYPSTPKEAFESANEGLYYGQQMAKLRSEGRICRVPYNDHSLVHTAWDIGLHDYTAIWIFQVSAAGEIRVLDYYENNGEPALHYVNWLKSKPYEYGTHILPHDAASREKSTAQSYADIIEPLIKGEIRVLDRDECNIFHGIQIVRSMLSRCVFDETKCMLGVKRLESYKKEWNDKLGCFRSSPLHDEASHGSDSFRYLCVGLSKIDGPKGSIENDMKAVRAYFGG